MRDTISNEFRLKKGYADDIKKIPPTWEGFNLDFYLKFLIISD